ATQFFCPATTSSVAAGARPPQDDRRSNEDRRVGADHDTDDDRQRKIAKHSTAKEEQTENWNQRDGAGQDRPAQRLVDARVHDLFDRASSSAGETFTNPVVN